MVASLIGIVVALLIAGVLVWAIDAMPAIDPTFKQVSKVIIIVVVVIFVILVLAGMFGWGPGLGLSRWR